MNTVREAPPLPLPKTGGTITHHRRSRERKPFAFLEFWRPQSLATGTVLVTVGAATSKLLGFIREALLAHFFGTSSIVDAYRVGETISAVSAGLGANTFEVAGIPLLVEREVKGGTQECRKLFASLWTVALLLGIVITSLVFLAAPLLVKLFAPRINPATAQLAVLTTRIMSFVAGAVVMISASGAYYNARRRFTIPRLVDPTVNVIAILFLLSWGNSHGINALTTGWTVGHFAGLILAICPLILTGHRLIRTLREPGIREFLRLSIPLLGLFLVRPLNLALGRAFASFLPAGNIAIIGYADRLFAFPCNIITAAVGTVLFTRMSELAASGAVDLLRHRLQTLLRWAGVVLIPASLILFIVAQPLVNLLYQHGAFSPADSKLTATALRLLGLGIFPFTAIALLAAFFRGVKDTKTPVLGALLGAGTTALFDILSLNHLGVAGLALGSTIGLLTNMAFLLTAFYVRR